MRALGVVLVLAALVGGVLVGRLLAPPEAPIGPSVVTASIAGTLEGEIGAPAATRQVTVGVSASDIEEDARALLEQAATQRDPAAAAQKLLRPYDLRGPSDACADGTAPRCPGGVPATLRSTPVAVPPPQAASSEVGRPPTAVYAVTPDLIAVSVAHREGENVTVLANARNSNEPECDTTVTGYDRLAHPLFDLESGIDPVAIAAAGWDPAFRSRTTVAFDINEGLSIYLCAQVLPRGTQEPNYAAEALVQTADRLVPTVSLDAATGLALPGWEIVGYLAGGQRCGSVRVPTVRTFTPVAIDLSPPRTICAGTDTPGASAAGRGVLQFSRGDGSTLTVAHEYTLGPAEYTSLDLGAAGLCRGLCTPPHDELYPVWGSRGTATVHVSWTQGSTNGATETTVGPVIDAAGGEAPPDATAPGIPRAPADLSQVIVLLQYRVNSDAYSVGASRTAAYLTVRAGDTLLVGPRTGQCFGDQAGFDGTGAVMAVVGDVVHISGSVQSVLLVPDVIGCVPDWPTSPLAITFSVDIPLSELRDSPDGIVLRIDQPLGADPSVRATASAIVRIRIAG